MSHRALNEFQFNTPEASVRYERDPEHDLGKVPALKREPR